LFLRYRHWYENSHAYACTLKLGAAPEKTEIAVNRIQQRRLGRRPAFVTRESSTKCSAKSAAADDGR
jgi:hypothetical protein